MSFPLFMADLAQPEPGDLVQVTGEEARHAVSVRRIRVGETVLIADGHGLAIQGEVAETGRELLAVLVDQVITEPLRNYRMIAVQALAKGDRADLAVELLTETGADEIIAWSAERSIVRWEGERVAKSIAKWQTRAREASKQSRRLSVPLVTHASTEQLLDRIQTMTALVLHEAATKRLADELGGWTGGQIAVITGPEGGITQRELDLFTGVGAKVVLVGDHVLRTSSAGGVALAQIQAVVGSPRQS